MRGLRSYTIRKLRKYNQIFGAETCVAITIFVNSVWAFLVLLSPSVMVVGVLLCELGRVHRIHAAEKD
jgi:hypothetical protein